MDYDPRDRQITWRDVCAVAALCLVIGLALFVPGSWPSSKGLSKEERRVIPSPGLVVLPCLAHVNRFMFHQPHDRWANADRAHHCLTSHPDET